MLRNGKFGTSVNSHHLREYRCFDKDKEKKTCSNLTSYMIRFEQMQLHISGTESYIIRYERVLI